MDENDNFITLEDESNQRTYIIIKSQYLTKNHQYDINCNILEMGINLNRLNSTKCNQPKNTMR